MVLCTSRLILGRRWMMIHLRWRGRGEQQTDELTLSDLLTLTPGHGTDGRSWKIRPPATRNNALRKMHLHHIIEQSFGVHINCTDRQRKKVAGPSICVIINSMCSKVDCVNCKKATWQGCGMHGE